jgi:hypothetical protein
MSDGDPISIIGLVRAVVQIRGERGWNALAPPVRRGVVGSTSGNHLMFAPLCNRIARNSNGVSVSNCSTRSLGRASDYCGWRENWR